LEEVFGEVASIFVAGEAVGEVFALSEVLLEPLDEIEHHLQGGQVVIVQLLVHLIH